MEQQTMVTENALKAMADLGIQNTGLYNTITCSEPSQLGQVRSKLDFKTITSPRKQEILNLIADAKKETVSQVSKGSERRKILQIKGQVSSPRARFNEDNEQQALEIRQSSGLPTLKIGDDSFSKNGSVAGSKHSN